MVGAIRRVPTSQGGKTSGITRGWMLDRIRGGAMGWVLVGRVQGDRIRGGVMGWVPVGRVQGDRIRGGVMGWVQVGRVQGEKTNNLHVSEEKEGRFEDIETRVGYENQHTLQR